MLNYSEFSCVHIFTDGSCNTQTKVGYGAYLIFYGANDSISIDVNTSQLNADSLKTNDLNRRVKIIRFEQTSSTKLELQTLLVALEEAIEEVTSSLKQGRVVGKDLTFICYTDSQNIIGLPARRSRLEKNNYLTSKGKIINNHDLYKAFYALTSPIKFDLVQVKGHKKISMKNHTDDMFTLVDRASRKALREDNNA